MYLTAISVLADQPVPGMEQARLSVVCHCIRELIAGVPTVLSETAIERPDPNSEALKKRLPRLFRRVDLDADQDNIPVPRAAAKVVSKLIKTIALEEGRNRQLASALITGGTDESHPAIRQWTDAQKFFQRWTHLDRMVEGEREVPSDDEIRAQLQVIEDVIASRGSLFFHNLRDVQDLLDEANQSDGEQP